MKRTNYYLKLMGGALLFQSLALQTMATQFKTGEGIGKILAKMEQKFNVKFGYDASISDQKINELVNLEKLKKEEIAQFIRTISDGHLEVRKIDDKLYVVSKKEKTASESKKLHAAQKELRGKIVDQETNLPIGGATIRVKGTAIAATTDQMGAFKLSNVSDQAILQVSFIGYELSEVPATSASLIRLSKSSEALEEVVVTALGIKREQKALGYAVQDIKGDQLAKVKGVDVGTTLTGRVSGLRVMNSTEFNRAPDIQLRGKSPLLVIDGVAYENMSLRDIAVDNIENISVLKGSTAAALYGIEGAGGAIMVTTKKGLSQKGVEITVNSNNMFFAGYLALPNVQSSYSAGYGGKYNTDDEVWGDKLDIGRKYKQWNPFTKQMDDVETELTSKGKNNFQNFLEPGFISNNSVSFTNQGENGSIRTSISHIYNKGQYPNTKLNMTNISVAGETKISDKVNLETRLGYNRRHAPNDFGSGYNNQGYIYNILVWTGPEYDLTQYKDYWQTENVSQNWLYKAWYDNPYLSAYEKISAELVNKLNAAVTLNYKMTDWGNFLLRSGYDYYGNSREQTNPMGIYGTRGGFDGSGGYDNRGKYWSRKQDGFSTTNDFIFTAKKNFGDFGIDALVGGSIFYRRDNTMTASTVNGLTIPGFYSLRNSTGPVSAVEGKTKEMRNGIYSRLSLSWRNAVFIEGTARNDWYSMLPDKSYFYPSVSGSVVVSDLIQKPNWLNLLKVRGSWASTVYPPDPYEINQTFGVSNNVWDGMTTASYPNIIKDYSINPTKEDMAEFGLEWAVLNSRLTGNYTYYARRRYNIKADISNSNYSNISHTTGFRARLINLKEERMTRGHEISLGGVPIRRENFEWSVNGNLSQNLQYYHKLDPDYTADALYIKEGMRTDHYVTRDWERSPDGEIIHNAAGMPISAVHTARLFGYTAPKWFWGITNQFQYKDFSLSFSFDGRIKGLSYSNMNARLWQTGAHPDSDTKERYEEVVNGKRTFVGKGVKIVSGEVSYDKYGQIIKDTRVFAPNETVVSYENYWKRAYSGTQNIWDETFIKLREVSLSYNLPREVASRFKAKKASIGVTGQNLFLWTKEYRFSDPDAGSEDLNSPSMRYLGFNISLSF
ncbi:SusC/RagA family TonB-linked outer membrane protein [Sphingobacterium detergens]|nr:SusC/RagA family TonB-linked outer membrane protein [Sphingobacterium detergens]